MNKPGILDTSTLILLGRVTAIDALPDAAFITAVTLAELSVGPLVATTDEDRAARQAHLQAAEQTSIHFHSTPRPRERSAASQPHCGAAAARQQRGPTTR